MCMIFWLLKKPTVNIFSAPGGIPPPLQRTGGGGGCMTASVSQCFPAWRLAWNFNLCSNPSKRRRGGAEIHLLLIESSAWKLVCIWCHFSGSLHIKWGFLCFFLTKISICTFLSLSIKSPFVHQRPWLQSQVNKNTMYERCQTPHTPKSSLTHTPQTRSYVSMNRMRAALGFPESSAATAGLFRGF